MPILSATAVFKTYRLDRVDVPVLRGVDLAVEKGEWVAILGASGSGKSTLLHILGGLDRPDRRRSDSKCHACGYSLAGLKEGSCPECGRSVGSGRVVFDGRRLDDMSNRELDRYRNTDVGFVFQFYHLLPELKVVENVIIGAMIRYGLGGYLVQRPGVRRRAEQLLESFGLGHRLGHRPGQLSGGERQRVAIARALINDPPILLADEPTGNLDRTTGHSILNAMMRHRTETGRTMIIVTHDPEVAARADRVVHLEDGRIVGGSGASIGTTPTEPGTVSPESER